MPVTLQNPVIGATNYAAIFVANNAAIEAAMNSLEAQITAAVGDGSQLLLDLFDRNGIVGTRSYRLDTENYEGGASIDIGHRPAADVAQGDSDTSIAWCTYGGSRQRVTLTGDVTMNAAGIISGLPKTIYIGVPSDGTPQFYEDAVTPNLLYIYSMTWDGYQLTEFKRMAPILHGYDLSRDLADVQREFSVLDTETDFLVDVESQISLITPGDAADNEIGVAGGREILGFFIDFPGDQEDGLYAPNGTDNKLVLHIESEAEVWSEDADGNVEIDASQEENFFQIAVNADIGDERYVTEMRRFKLVVDSVGADVISARRFTWGYYWRPIFGQQVPIDTDRVNLV